LEALARIDHDYYPLRLLEAILGGGASSRLWSSVREKKGLAYTVHSDVECFHDTGGLFVYAGVGLDKVEEAVKAILAEFSKITRKKVPAKELQRAKDLLKGRLVLSLEDTAGIGRSVGSRELLDKSILTIEDISNLIDRVTVDDVFRVATRIFQEEKLNLSLVGPFKDKGRFQKLLTL
jgi:predicted Zn-dependent peptidase